MTTPIAYGKGIIASALEGLPVRYRKQNQAPGLPMASVVSTRLFLDVVGFALGGYAACQWNRRSFCTSGWQMTGGVMLSHAAFLGALKLEDRVNQKSVCLTGLAYSFTQGAALTFSWIALSKGIDQGILGKRFFAISLLGSLRGITMGVTLRNAFQPDIYHL